MTQFHFTPGRYLGLVRQAIPVYDEFQEAISYATNSVKAGRVLDLGTGTGETAKRVLDRHAAARLTAIDASAEMLKLAQAELPSERIEQVIVGGIEQPLPPGPFDLVVSALAVHHLDGSGKADLFRRVAAVLAPGGRFVMGDVVIPEQLEDAVTPLSGDHDRPDRADDLMLWLAAAGLAPRVAWAWRDLVVIAADRDQDQSDA